MVASDQVGISVINPKTFLANKTKENKEDSKEKGLNLGIFNMLKEKKRDANEFQRIKNEAFGNTSSNIGKTDTKVASSDSAGSGGGYIDAGSRGFVSPEQATKMLTYPERFRMKPGEIKYLRGSMPIKKVDASDNKIYSDSTQTLGGTEGSLIAMADTKVNETKREGSKFFSSAFNNEANSQTATDRTRMAGEGIFRSGISSEAFSPTVKPQYQINREKNRPNRTENVAEAGARTPFGSVNLNIARGVDTATTTNKAEDTSFSSYVRGARPGQERGNTRLAQARKVVKRNPNVSINKSTGKAEATNDSGKAKAQAAALNRKMSGGGERASGSDRAKAAYKRNIKRGHKGTASASAANKASMRKRAKARHKASQAKRRARNKARSRRRRSRRSRSRRCDLRFKFNIMPLTNMNLIRDDLAEVAYFVKELQA